MRALGLALVMLAAACGRSATCEQDTDACSCYRRPECAIVTEPCWCPSECNPQIACVCGGGKFLRCETRSPHP